MCVCKSDNGRLRNNENLEDTITEFVKNSWQRVLEIDDVVFFCFFLIPLYNMYANKTNTRFDSSEKDARVIRFLR